MATRKAGAPAPQVIDAVARQVDGPILGKPPLSRIDCSRIIVSVNGQQYAPHHGESVWKAYGLQTAGINLVQLVARIDVLLAQIQRASDDPDTDVDTMTGLADELNETIDGLDRGIVETVVKWDWTDPQGASMGPRPTLETVRGLAFEERYMLATLLFGQPVQSGDPVGN